VSVRRKLALLRLQHPVVAVVGDAQISFSLESLYRESEIVDEPSCEATAPMQRRIMFVIVHDDHAVGGRRDRGVIEF